MSMKINRTNTKTRTKGIAIDIIGYMLIALAGISLLLLFISGSLRGLARNAFCFFYRVISDEETELCKSEPTGGEMVELKPETREDLATYVGAYAIKCWEETNKPFMRKDKICYQLMLEKKPGKISELFFTQIFEQGRGCSVLWNSMIVDESGNYVQYPGECGDEDQIEWDVSGNVIENQSLILIKYNTISNKIIIKA